MLYEKEIGSRDFCGGILYYVCYGNGLSLGWKRMAERNGSVAGNGQLSVRLLGQRMKKRRGSERV